MRPRLFTAALAFALFAPAVAIAQGPAKPDTTAKDDDDDDDDEKPAPSPEPVKEAAKPDEKKEPAKTPAETPAMVEQKKDETKDAKKEAKKEKDDDDDDDDDDEKAKGPAKLQYQWGGVIQSDLRFRPIDVGTTPWFDGRGLKKGVDRNQNLAGLRLSGAYGRLTFKTDLDFILYGYSRDVREFSDLTRQEKLDPYRFDAMNIYVEVSDLFVNGLDLRIGQQIIDWGVGDQFNPTNNLNADNVEDVLLFGKQQGNFMVKLNYWLNEEWSHEFVLVPVFRPALLPRSAELGLSRVDRIPVADDATRWRLLSENSVASDVTVPVGATAVRSRNPVVVRNVTPDLPELSFENMQFGYKIGGTVLDQDISLSYYRGRFDFPMPYRNHVVQDLTTRCNPDDATDCTQSRVFNDVSLMYPRMHVYGLNLAGEIPWLKRINEKVFHSIGYRLEAALVVPDEVVHLQIDRDALQIKDAKSGIAVQKFDGVPNYLNSPAVYENRAFLKWVLGLDYTFNEYVYTNVQWIHGFPDEFGAGDFIHKGYVVGAADVPAELDAATKVGCAIPEGQKLGDYVHVDPARCAHEYLRPRLGDYLAWGFDFKALSQKLLIRVFTIFALNGIIETGWDAEAGERYRKYHSMFTKEGFSAILYPEINYNFGNGLDLGIGALGMLGKEWTKFGDPATGGTIVWSRARFHF
jgi:hypothetical protein